MIGAVKLGVGIELLEKLGRLSRILELLESHGFLEITLAGNGKIDWTGGFGVVA